MRNKVNETLTGTNVETGKKILQQFSNVTRLEWHVAVRTQCTRRLIVPNTVNLKEKVLPSPHACKSGTTVVPELSAEIALGMPPGSAGSIPNLPVVSHHFCLLYVYVSALCCGTQYLGLSISFSCF